MTKNNPNPPHDADREVRVLAPATTRQSQDGNSAQQQTPAAVPIFRVGVTKIGEPFDQSRT
jgi:hypothetical protein